MTIRSALGDALLGWLGEASIVLGLVVLVVLLARRAARGRMGAGWTYALWLAVPAALVATLAPNGVVALPFDLPFGSSANEAVLEPGALLVPARPRGPSVADIVSVAALTTWLVGLAGFLAAHLAAQWRFERAVVRAARRPTDDERIELAAAALETPLLAERDFRFSDRVASPVACGLFRPVVLLPESFLTRYGRDERRVMVLHEGEHVGGKHLVHRVAATVLRSVFWFHPLAWWGERAFIADQELACDQAALGRDSSIRPRTYAATLLKTASSLGEASPRPPAAGVPLITIHHLKERTAMLARHAALAKTRAAGIAAVGVVGALSVLTGLSACVGATAQDESLSTRVRDAEMAERLGALAQGERDIAEQEFELERAAQELEAAQAAGAERQAEEQRRAFGEAQRALAVQRRELERARQELEAELAQRGVEPEWTRVNVFPRPASAGETEYYQRVHVIPVEPGRVLDRAPELEELRRAVAETEEAHAAGEADAAEVERARRRLADAQADVSRRVEVIRAAPSRNVMIVRDRFDDDLEPDDLRREIAMTEERLERLRSMLEDAESAGDAKTQVEED